MKKFNSYRDWKWMMIFWLVGVLLIFGAAGLISGWRYLSRDQVVAGEASPKAVFDERALRGVVEMIDKRDQVLEARKAFPDNLVDPSR